MFSQIYQNTTTVRAQKIMIKKKKTPKMLWKKGSEIIQAKSNNLITVSVRNI